MHAPDPLSRFVLAHASGRSILLALAVTVVSFAIMAAVIAPAFAEATGGLRPFDMNFGIDAATVYSQLPAYTERARSLYVWFAIVDFVYPAAAAAFFALLWAWMFAGVHEPLFARLTAAGVLLLPFLFTLVDWLENTGFLFVIFSYPSEFPAVATIAGSLKALKPVVEIVVLLATLLFAGMLIRRRRGAGPVTGAATARAPEE